MCTHSDAWHLGPCARPLFAPFHAPSMHYISIKIQFVTLFWQRLKQEMRPKKNRSEATTRTKLTLIEKVCDALFVVAFFFFFNSVSSAFYILFAIFVFFFSWFGRRWQKEIPSVTYVRVGRERETQRVLERFLINLICSWAPKFCLIIYSKVSAHILSPSFLSLTLSPPLYLCLSYSCWVTVWLSLYIIHVSPPLHNSSIGTLTPTDLTHCFQGHIKSRWIGNTAAKAYEYFSCLVIRNAVRKDQTQIFQLQELELELLFNCRYTIWKFHKFFISSILPSVSD